LNLTNIKMKFTLFTLLVAALFSLAFAYVIPAKVQLSAATISARAPAGDDDSISAPLEAAVEARGNDCGSSPFQNPDCSVGNNLKIERGVVIRGVLGAMIAGCLL
jgi:hypothetical protein